MRFIMKCREVPAAVLQPVNFQKFAPHIFVTISRKFAHTCDGNCMKSLIWRTSSRRAQNGPMISCHVFGIPVRFRWFIRGHRTYYTHGDSSIFYTFSDPAISVPLSRGEVLQGRGHVVEEFLGHWRSKQTHSRTFLGYVQLYWNKPWSFQISLPVIKECYLQLW